MMNKSEEKTMEDFILYLYDGYRRFSHDKYAKHVLFIAIRYLTATIGECKNLKISQKAEVILGECKDLKMIKKAQKDNPNETVKEHKIPVKIFWDQFRSKKGKDFTRVDAKRWLKDATIAIITKDEDKKITDNGWRTVRPNDAYEKLGIVLKDIE